MISSRRPVHRSPVVAHELMEVPLRETPAPLSQDGAISPEYMRQSAEAEARAIVAEAEVQREQVLKDAWSEGYDAGRQEGLAQTLGGLRVAEHMVEAMAEEISGLPERMAAEVTAMALEVAARIVRAELSVRPERVVDIVRGAIRRATDREQMVIHVNPDDVAMVREAAPNFADQIGGIQRIHVVDDPRIPAGGCIVETASGDVDARLTSQFNRMAEALAEEPDEDYLDAIGTP